MENPSYYSILTAEVRYCKEISANEKILFSEITALMQMNGECYASNNYFASLFDVTPQAISKWINHLIRLNFISVKYTYKQGSKEIEKRVLGINNGFKGINNGLRGYQQRIKDNTIYNNNIVMQIEAKQKKFIPPTIEQINKYVEDNSINVDTQKFFKYYTASEWKDNKGKQIHNWKLKLITWDNQSAPKQQKKRFEDMTFEEKMEYNEQERQRKIEANYGDL